MEKFIAAPIGSPLSSKSGYVASAHQIAIVDPSGNITSSLPEYLDTMQSDLMSAISYALTNSDSIVAKTYYENQPLTLNWFGGVSINTKYSGDDQSAKLQLGYNTAKMEWKKGNSVRDVMLTSNGVYLDYMQGGGSGTLSIDQHGLCYNNNKVLTEDDYTVTINGTQYKNWQNIQIDGSGQPVNLSNYYTKSEVDNLVVLKANQPSTGTTPIKIDNTTSPSGVIKLFAEDGTAVDKIWTNSTNWAASATNQSVPTKKILDDVYVSKSELSNGAFTAEEKTRIGTIIDLQGLSLNVATEELLVDSIDKCTNPLRPIDIYHAVDITGDVTVSGDIYTWKICNEDYDMIKRTATSSSDCIDIGDLNDEPQVRILQASGDVKVLDDESDESVIVTEKNYTQYINNEQLIGVYSVDSADVTGNVTAAIRNLLSRTFSSNEDYQRHELLVKTTAGFMGKLFSFSPNSSEHTEVVLEGGFAATEDHSVVTISQSLTYHIIQLHISRSDSSSSWLITGCTQLL